MGLGLDIGAFLTGVQERGQEYDEALASRMKTLSEGKDDTNLKTKFAKEVDNYDKDKELLKAVKSAYAAGDWAKGQQLLGDFASLDAYWKAKEMNSDMHYKLPKLGEEPVFTKADYGVTNGTTAGNIVESFLNPEAYKKRRKSETPTAATYTKYERKTDEEGNIEYDRSEEEVATAKAGLVELQKAYRHKSKKDELETVIANPDIDGQWLTITLTKNANYKTTGPQAADLGGKAELFSGYSVTKKVRFKPDGAIADGTPLEFTRTGVIVDKNDNILKNQKTFLRDVDGVNLGESLLETGEAGYRRAQVKVTAHRTNNNKDTIEMPTGEVWKGWKSVEELVVPKPIIEKPTTQNYIKDNEDGSFTKYTLTLHPEGLTGDTAKSLGGDSNIYKGYQVTNAEPYQPSDRSTKRGTIQEHIEQRWVLNGNIANDEGVEYTKETEGAEYLDVKFKSKYTGEKGHSIKYANGIKDVGWLAIGHDIADPTDARTNKQKEMDEDVKRIMLESSLGVDYSGIIKRLKIVDKNDNPLPLTPEIASIIVERRNMLKVTEEGEIIDIRASQFDTPTPLYDLAPEGYIKPTHKQITKFVQGHLGKIDRTKYYHKIHDNKNYMGWIISKANLFAGKYFMDEAAAVDVVERIGLLGVMPRGKTWNPLGFYDSTVIFRHSTQNKNDENYGREYTLDDIIQGAIKFKTNKSQQSNTWNETLDDFFEKLEINEEELNTKRNEFL